MLSTPSLSNPIIRLVDRTSDVAIATFATFRDDDVGDRVDIDDTGSVYEDHRYTMQLLFPSEPDCETVHVSINSGDLMPARLDLVRIPGESWLAYNIAFTGSDSDRKDRSFLFGLTYGFVRIRLEFPDGLCCTTRDVLCQSTRGISGSSVQSMLSRVLDTDDSKVANWMFDDGRQDNGSYAVIDGGSNAYGSKSLSSYLSLVEEILRDYDGLYPFFRRKASSTVTRTQVKRTGLEARLLGSNEFIWLMKNAEVLSPTDRETGITDGDRYYFPSYIQTQQRRRTYDTEENRVVLGFISLINKTLSSIHRELADSVTAARQRLRRLASLREDGHFLPALVVMEECTRRSERFESQAYSLRRKAQSLQRRYEKILPGVKPLMRLDSKPRRNKAFQEVMGYSLLYTDIERWWDFRSFTLAREAIALHVLKLDKLYEYYVLFVLLEELVERGYSLDDDEGPALIRGAYSLEGHDRYFNNERRVNCIYKLRNESQRVTLYYQPVIYGDSREEHGVRLHRLSKQVSFSNYNRDSHYTPDYLIVLEGMSDHRRTEIIFDAKYSHFGTLSFSEKGSKWSIFNETLFKYKTDVVSNDLRPVEAVWLLSGTEAYSDYAEYEAASWVSAREGYLPSGMAAVSPELNGLDKLFRRIGVEPASDNGFEESEEENRNRTENGVGSRRQQQGVLSETTPVANGTAGAINGSPYSTAKDESISAVISSESSTRVSDMDNDGKRRKTKSEIKEEAYESIAALITSHPRTQDLFDRNWAFSKRIVAQRVPLLRRPDEKIPGRMGSKYEAHSFPEVGEVYVWAEWNRMRVQLLNGMVPR